MFSVSITWDVGKIASLNTLLVGVDYWKQFSKYKVGTLYEQWKLHMILTQRPPPPGPKSSDLGPVSRWQDCCHYGWGHSLQPPLQPKVEEKNISASHMPLHMPDHTIPVHMCTHSVKKTKQWHQNFINTTWLMDCCIHLTEAVDPTQNCAGMLRPVMPHTDQEDFQKT